jgi:DNA-binding FrmR family transcriptional regulator
VTAGSYTTVARSAARLTLAEATPSSRLSPRSIRAAQSPQACPQACPQLQTRLRRIEGKVRGVARMIDEDKYCVDVVTQVAAIQAALDKVSLGLLDGHIRGCVREEIESGGGDAKVDELLQVMDRVLRR